MSGLNSDAEKDWAGGQRVSPLASPAMTDTFSSSTAHDTDMAQNQRKEAESGWLKENCLSKKEVNTCSDRAETQSLRLVDHAFASCIQGELC